MAIIRRNDPERGLARWLVDSYAGEGIAQILFFRADGVCKTSYGEGRFLPDRRTREFFWPPIPVCYALVLAHS